MRSRPTPEVLGGTSRSLVLVSGVGGIHTRTHGLTRVCMHPPALPYLLQSSRDTRVRAGARATDVVESWGRHRPGGGGPGASKSGFSPVQQAIGSRGTHPDLRLPPLPQLHPSSGRRGQAGLVFAFGEVLHLKQKPPGLSWTSCPATNRPRRSATASAGHSGDSLFSSARWGDRAGSAGCGCRCHVTVWMRVSACGSKCSADVQWELFFFYPHSCWPVWELDAHADLTWLGLQLSTCTQVPTYRPPS